MLIYIHLTAAQLEKANQCLLTGSWVVVMRGHQAAH